ncbi:uncharacterized protein LOC144711109 [Wolffia australiana]
MCAQVIPMDIQAKNGMKNLLTRREERQEELYGDDEGENILAAHSGRRYDPGCPIDNITIQLGMTYESRSQFKAAVKNYAICNGFNVRIKRSTENVVEVVCQEHCPWRIYASWGPTREAFVIKAVNDEHRCNRTPTNIQADYRWITKHFLETIRRDMNYRVIDMVRELHEKYGIIVSRATCYSARSWARKMLQGSLDEHYHMLPSYVAELQKVHRNSTFQLEVEHDIHNSLPRFNRLYICFESLARGFLEGCRPVIGLDGCFLKTELKGQLLSTVGRDGNNMMFPIAWAVVEGENQASWIWFISLLMSDLGIVDGYGWTIISDQQKGLENAVAGLLPNAEHRNCARHIYANWKKKGHSTYILRNLFWKAVKCTACEGFHRVIGQMKTLKAEAVQDLLEGSQSSSGGFSKLLKSMTKFQVPKKK